MAHLLLVDDNVQLLGLYKMVLEQAGHHVRTAETRGEAVELLRATDPDIVLMDLRVPEMEDGLRLIRTLRDHIPAARQTPVRIVVISGWTEDLDGTPERCSVDRVLPKPVRIEVLLRSISELALMVFLCLAGVRSANTEARWLSCHLPPVDGAISRECVASSENAEPFALRLNTPAGTDLEAGSAFIMEACRKPGS